MAASGRTAHGLGMTALGELVDSVAEKDARAFLLHALKRYDMLATEFTQRFGSVDVEGACQRLDDQVQDAIWDCSGGGFIGWRESFDFERRYFEVMHTSIDPMVERNEFDAAIGLSVQALRSLEPIEVDDSNGFFTSVIDDVKRMWEKWLDCGAADIDERLFTSVVGYIAEEPEVERERDIHSYGSEMATEFITRSYIGRPEFSERIVRLADERIEEAEDLRSDAQRELERASQQSATGATGKRRGRQTHAAWQARQEEGHWKYFVSKAEGDITRWALIRLRALRTSGLDDEALLAEAGPLVVREPICQFFVDAAMRRGDVALALHLLRDCKEACLAADGRYPVAVSRQIADLSEGRDLEALRSELRYLLGNVTRADVSERAEDLWLRLRRTYDEETWPQVRDGLLRDIEPASTRLRCLHAEGLYDRLMEAAESEGLAALYPFEADLVDRYPERVLRLYLDDLEKYRRYPGGGRGDYKQLADRLRHVQALPGGAEPVHAFVAELCELYPRKRALRDELSRV